MTARKVEKLFPFQQYSKPKVFKIIFKESKDRREGERDREIKIEGGGEKWTNSFQQNDEKWIFPFKFAHF